MIATPTTSPPELFDPARLKRQAWTALARAERGESEHFDISHVNLDRTVKAVAEALAPTIHRQPPPLKNCWYRLQENFADDLDHLAKTLERASDDARARTGLDLALITTLADPAGNNDDLFIEAVNDFLAGEFTEAERGVPVLDAGGLAAEGLPAWSVNWSKDLQKLLSGKGTYFGEGQQFGAILTKLREHGEGRTISALRCFETLAPLLYTLWPGPTLIGRKTAGDAWRAAGLFGRDAMVSFQAPILRLIEAADGPLTEAGLSLSDLHELPTIADRQLLQALFALEIVLPKHSAVTRLDHPAGSDIVIEFRCLSIALADRLSDHLTKSLECTSERLPPQRTVVALSELAARADSGPSIHVTSKFF